MPYRIDTKRKAEQVLKQNNYYVVKSRGKGSHTIYHNYEKHDTLSLGKRMKWVEVEGTFKRHGLTW